MLSFNTFLALTLVHFVCVVIIVRGKDTWRINKFFWVCQSVLMWSVLLFGYGVL